MKITGLLLLSSLLFFILSPAVMGQTPASSPSVSPVQEEQEKEATQVKVRYITIIIILLITILFVSFVTLRIRAKLKNADSHKKPIAGLASKNAGIIFKDKSSDEE